MSERQDPSRRTAPRQAHEAGGPRTLKSVPSLAGALLDIAVPSPGLAASKGSRVCRPIGRLWALTESHRLAPQVSAHSSG